MTEECRLMRTDTIDAKIRIVAEAIMLLGACIYLASAVREARFLGVRMFFENLVSLFNTSKVCFRVPLQCVLDDSAVQGHVLVLVQSAARDPPPPVDL